MSICKFALKNTGNLVAIASSCLLVVLHNMADTLSDQNVLNSETCQVNKVSDKGYKVVVICEDVEKISS